MMTNVWITWRETAGATVPFRRVRRRGDRTVHRPRLPVRVLGRADPPAPALALRRTAGVDADDDRAHARTGRGREARGRRARAPAQVRHADRPRALRAPVELGAGLPR